MKEAAQNPWRHVQPLDETGDAYDDGDEWWMITTRVMNERMMDQEHFFVGCIALGHFLAVG